MQALEFLLVYELVVDCTDYTVDKSPYPSLFETIPKEEAMCAGEEIGEIVETTWSVPYKFYILTRLRVWRSIDAILGFETTFTVPKSDRPNCYEYEEVLWEGTACSSFASNLQPTECGCEICTPCPDTDVPLDGFEGLDNFVGYEPYVKMFGTSSPVTGY